MNRTPFNKKAWRTLLSVAAVAAVAAGCGVPTSSSVAKFTIPSKLTQPPRPTRTGTTTTTPTSAPANATLYFLTAQSTVSPQSLGVQLIGVSRHLNFGKNPSLQHQIQVVLDALAKGPTPGEAQNSVFSDLSKVRLTVSGFIGIDAVTVSISGQFPNAIPTSRFEAYGQIVYTLCSGAFRGIKGVNFLYDGFAGADIAVGNFHRGTVGRDDYIQLRPGI